MDAKAHWERVHAENAEDDVSWFLPEPRIALRMMDAAGVTPDARVLDVGCGVAGVADALLARGFTRVHALDVSRAALERAQERLGERAARVTWHEADVTRLALDERFDVWHDRAVLHFLTRAEDQRAYVHALERHVTPGGLVVLATFALDGPEQCSGLPVARYDADALARLLGDGFERVDDARDVHVTPWSTEQAFTWAAFRRRA